ncbi:Fe-S cluster assembly protein NifU [Pseudaeromonas paramecii]|uniref:Nitrogen fixation protein NifU n=1 Tax=Pseudaeromonas paramecii TaxID=2138166 RepID=A0ABP8Q821_9GAMM
MWNYSEKVKDHFFNPRNAKVVADANAIGDVGSISCGDALRLMLKVNPDSEVIEDAGFQTFGCGSAIASSSALTEMIIGRTLAEAGEISNQQIADFLDGLPPEKMHCSVMGKEALEAAIANFRGEVWRDDHEEGALICKCFAVDEVKIIKAVKENGLTSLTEVINYTKAGGGCSACHEKIEQVLEKVLATTPCAEARISCDGVERSSIAPMVDLAKKDERWQAVAKVLEGLRPHLQADGGDVTLISVSDKRVEVALSGSCMGCMMTDMTLAWIQQKLMEATGEYLQVVSAAQAELA